MATRLGELLIENGMLTKRQLSEALRYQRENGGRLGSALIENGYVTDHQIAQVLGRQYDLKTVELKSSAIDPEAIEMVPLATATRHRLLPVRKHGTTLTVAVVDPTNLPALDELQFMTGCRIEPVVVAESTIQALLEECYGSGQTLELERVYDELKAGGEHQLDIQADGAEVNLSKLQSSSTEAPIIKLVNLIVGEAIRKGASDVHLEPYEKELRVRYRIDGVLYNVMSPPLDLKDAMISRIKIMANMDIGERRLPQDGRIKLRLNQGAQTKETDLRVSSLPTLFGEKVVLRILDREKLPLDLTRLGLEPASLARFNQAITQPYGMVLVTGPTGSGKSSTLYACLNKLNTNQVNIMTAEDPIEYNFFGINQLQIKEQIGLNFAAALRSFLRQDPDIVMVGEVRDRETAEIAIKAALTGHLVLSTLHTNDAPSTISRLINMGVEPFMVASSVHLICAQRLVRRICRHCKQPCGTPPELLVDLGLPPATAKKTVVHAGKGCARCHNTGYQGRIGLFEVMKVSETIQSLILSGADSNRIRTTAIKEGMITLRDSGLEKLRSGITTVDEVLRETTLHR